MTRMHRKVETIASEEWLRELGMGGWGTGKFRLERGKPWKGREGGGNWDGGGGGREMGGGRGFFFFFFFFFFSLSLIP